MPDTEASRSLFCHPTQLPSPMRVGSAVKHDAATRFTPLLGPCGTNSGSQELYQPRSSQESSSYFTNVNEQMARRGVEEWEHKTLR